jgi:succinylarginine dihydrolase
VARWIERHLASNGAIRRVDFVDVRQSMANGGGPACLRLRVVCDPATVDPRFLVDEAKLDRLAAVISAHWPEEIAPGALTDPGLVAAVIAARAAMLDALDLSRDL